MKRPIITILLAALLLFGASAALGKTAETNAQAELLRMMQTLLPGSAVFTEEAYTGSDANIRSVHKGESGVVVETVTAGYAGDITLLVGVSEAGKVTGLVVRSLSETAGLGAEALNDHAFLSQFLNTSGNAAVGETVDALTGATVTSKAIARGVNSAISYVTGTDASSGATAWGG